MTTLSVTVAAPQCARAKYSLLPVQVDAHPEHPQLIQYSAYTATSLLHKRNSVVFRGTLESGDGEAIQRKDAVCKMVFGLDAAEQAKHEAEVYTNQLRNLQGDFVPQFFAIYEGIRHKIKVTCLFLEYCGEPALCYLDKIPIDLNVQICEALMSVHLAGISHNDLDVVEKNVVVDSKGKPRLIDFEYAKRHKCRSKMEIDLYDFRPRPDKVNCSEIYDVTDQLGIWTPYWVSFIGGPVPITEARSPEELAARVPDLYAERPRYVMERAQGALDEYKKWYGDRPIVRHILKMDEPEPTGPSETPRPGM